MSRPKSKFKEFLYHLFTLNFQSMMTDEQLKHIIRRTYPTSKLDVQVGRHKDRLSIWRSEYNRGRLSGMPGSIYSVPYVDKKPATPFGKELDAKQSEQFRKDCIEARRNYLIWEQRQQCNEDRS